MTGIQQPSAEMRANKASATGDQDAFTRFEKVGGCHAQDSVSLYSCRDWRPRYLVLHQGEPGVFRFVCE